MISVDFSTVTLKLKQDAGKTLVFDPVRKKWVILTPEEHVRQYILHYLIETLRYPISLVAVEKQILIGKRTKRFDIVIYDREHKPWMLVECKEPNVPITETTLQQLLSYHNTMQSRYWLLTNGPQLFCADAADIQRIVWLSSLPAYEF